MEAGLKESRAETRENFASEKLAGVSLEKIAGDASFRSYYRAKGCGESYILMDAPPEKEDCVPFIKVTNFLVDAGFVAPKIIAQDLRNGFLLLQDLGDDLFSRVLAADGMREFELYKLAADFLLEIQKNSPAIELKNYDEAELTRELEIFCDYYLDKNLGDEFLQIWQRIFGSHMPEQKYFVHRDFHADNLLITQDAKLGLLDYQDALLGSAAYDLASLLRDARRDVGAQTAQKIYDIFLKNSGFDADWFAAEYNIISAQRNLKILGIFNRLKIRDGKDNYQKFMPRVLDNLRADLAHESLSELKNFLAKNSVI